MGEMERETGGETAMVERSFLLSGSLWLKGGWRWLWEESRRARKGKALAGERGSDCEREMVAAVREKVRWTGGGLFWFLFGKGEASGGLGKREVRVKVFLRFFMV